MTGGLVPVPGPMPWGDRNRSVRRVAAIAFQVCPGEEKDADIDQEDNRHSDEQGDVVGESQEANQGEGEGEHDHEPGHLGECLPLVNALSADETVPEAALIVKRLVPVEVDIAVIFRRSNPCGASLGIDVQGRRSPARLLDEDPHAVNGTGGSEGVANFRLVPDDHRA